MLYRSERMANTWESYFGMGKCGHISANRVGESFRRAMKEGLGDMQRLNSEAEDEEEADSAVWGGTSTGCVQQDTRVGQTDPRGPKGK
jgi:hypothetical protein